MEKVSKNRGLEGNIAIPEFQSKKREQEEAKGNKNLKTETPKQNLKPEIETWEDEGGAVEFEKTEKERAKRKY